MLGSALTAILDHLLREADWARARLRPFAGKAVRFVVPPFQTAFAVAADGGILEHAGEATDVVIRLPADTPFLLLHGLDRLMAAAHVEGNAEFATELSFVLRNLRWDAEEDLSRFVGDIAARRLGQGARQISAWQQQALANLRVNVAEYLLHESRLAVPREEFSLFRDEVARLAQALDRLEMRCPPSA